MDEADRKLMMKIASMTDTHGGSIQQLFRMIGDLQSEMSQIKQPVKVDTHLPLVSKVEDKSLGALEIQLSVDGYLESTLEQRKEISMEFFHEVKELIKRFKVSKLSATFTKHGMV